MRSKQTHQQAAAACRAQAAVTCYAPCPTTGRTVPTLGPVAQPIYRLFNN